MADLETLFEGVRNKTFQIKTAHPHPVSKRKKNEQRHGSTEEIQHFIWNRFETVIIQPYLSHLFAGYFLFLWEGLEIALWRLRIDFSLLSPLAHCRRPLYQLFKRRFPIKQRWESRHFR